MSTVEAYEYYADLFVGCAMVFFGLHFLVRSGKYFDAEWKPKQASCHCHAHADDTAKKPDHAPHRHGPHDAHHPHDHHRRGDEEAPLLGEKGEQAPEGFARKAGAYGIGFLQGMA